MQMTLQEVRELAQGQATCKCRNGVCTGIFWVFILDSPQAPSPPPKKQWIRWNVGTPIRLDLDVNPGLHWAPLAHWRCKWLKPLSALESRACPLGFWVSVGSQSLPVSGLLEFPVPSLFSTVGTEPYISFSLCVPPGESTHAEYRWAVETWLEILLGETWWHHWLAVLPPWSITAPSVNLNLSPSFRLLTLLPISFSTLSPLPFLKASTLFLWRLGANHTQAGGCLVEGVPATHFIQAFSPTLTALFRSGHLVSDSLHLFSHLSVITGREGRKGRSHSSFCQLTWHFVAPIFHKALFQHWVQSRAITFCSCLLESWAKESWPNLPDLTQPLSPVFRTAQPASAFSSPSERSFYLCWCDNKYTWHCASAHCSTGSTWLLRTVSFLGQRCCRDDRLTLMVESKAFPIKGEGSNNTCPRWERAGCMRELSPVLW